MAPELWKCCSTTDRNSSDQIVNRLSDYWYKEKHMAVEKSQLSKDSEREGHNQTWNQTVSKQ